MKPVESDGPLAILETGYAPPDPPGVGRRKRPRLDRVTFEHAGRRYACRVVEGRWEYEVQQLASEADPAEGAAGGGGWYRWRERWAEDGPEEVAAGVVYEDRLRRDVGARWQLSEGHHVGDSRMVTSADGTSWEVYEWEAGDESPPERRGRRCLILAAGEETRRLWEYPRAWRDLPDERLAALAAQPDADAR